MSGPTVQTPDLLLMPAGPAQRVEIHQTLIVRQLPPRVHTIGQVGSAEGTGGGRGWLAVAQYYTVKATYTQVEPLDKEQKRVDREDSSKRGQALQWNLS